MSLTRRVARYTCRSIPSIGTVLIEPSQAAQTPGVSGKCGNVVKAGRRLAPRVDQSSSSLRMPYVARRYQLGPNTDLRYRIAW